MEAALMALRRSCGGNASTDDVSEALHALLRGDGWAHLKRIDRELDEHDPRWLKRTRARVAIALRAALRADEDARCEEVLAEHEQRASIVRKRNPSAVSWADGADSGSALVLRLMREWPRRYHDRVPIALWERRPSLWAASPPTSGGPRHG
jgi:hypothetical protein